VVGEEYFAIRIRGGVDDEEALDWTRSLGGGASAGQGVRDGGYFRALQLLATSKPSSAFPAGGGADGFVEERRSSPRTGDAERLEEIDVQVRTGGVNVEPMQLAALLLEKTARQLSEDEASLYGGRRASRERPSRSAGTRETKPLGLVFCPMILSGGDV